MAKPLPRLLILHDSPHFGGHERMALTLLAGVVAARAYDHITFAFPNQNARLGEALGQMLPTIKQLPGGFVKRRGEPYLRSLRWRYRVAVRRLIAAEHPDTILLIQGRVENLATAMLAVPRHVRLVSYLPMAHRMKDMGRSGLVGDAIRRPVYRRPDAYIVPSRAVAQQVKAAGGTVPMWVATNVVDPPPRTALPVARLALGLPAAAKIALVLGRLEVAQKGLDRLIAAVRGMPSGHHWHFLIVGDGPGQAMMTAFASENAGRVTVIAWTDRPDLYLSAADVLLMPSRWEGLPLAALEAMVYGVPVLASPIDAFAGLLPRDHLIDWEQDNLASALDRVDAPAARAGYATHGRAVLASASLAEAQRAFLDGLLGRQAA